VNLNKKHVGSSLEDFLQGEGLLAHEPGSGRSHPRSEKGNITIESLERAAALLGRRIRLELI
jgi:hypothetical protein